MPSTPFVLLPSAPGAPCEPTPLEPFEPASPLAPFVPLTPSLPAAPLTPLTPFRPSLPLTPTPAAPFLPGLPGLLLPHFVVHTFLPCELMTWHLTGFFFTGLASAAPAKDSEAIPMTAVAARVRGLICILILSDRLSTVCMTAAQDATRRWHPCCRHPEVATYYSVGGCWTKRLRMYLTRWRLTSSYRPSGLPILPVPIMRAGSSPWLGRTGSMSRNM